MFTMWFHIDFMLLGVCVWVQMKHLNKGRVSHSSTQAPLRPCGLWYRRSRTVERQTLRYGRIVRWEKSHRALKGNSYGSMYKREPECALMTRVKLGLASVAVVFVHCIWQLAASFRSCHFYFLSEWHLTVEGQILHAQHTRASLTYMHSTTQLILSITEFDLQGTDNWCATT